MSEATMSDRDWQKAHAAQVATFPSDIREAHKHSSRHRSELMKSDACGCFYCGAIYTAAAIDEWIDDDETALCPKCGIDSVIGDASGFPVSADFLRNMKTYWFWV